MIDFPLIKQLLGRTRKIEMVESLSYEKHYLHGKKKRKLTQLVVIRNVSKYKLGILYISAPRDRDSRFEPVSVSEEQTLFANFGKKSLSCMLQIVTV